MNYRPKHYVIQELVPPEIYRERGDASWELLDGAMLVTADALRDYFGPIIINNWHTGGPLSECGFCSSGSNVHAKLSQHKFGRANDSHPVKVTPQEMHAAILKNRDKFPYITVMEDIEYTKGWVHFDTRNIIAPEIVIVKPKLK